MQSMMQLEADHTLMDAANAAHTLRGFMCPRQLSTLGDLCRSDESQFFIDKMVELAHTIDVMPKTYDTRNQGDEAVVYLHYFIGGCDWFITEKDMEDEQYQAFGLADLGMGYPELGYIPIVELTANGVELDLHWKPKTLAEVKRAQGYE